MLYGHTLFCILICVKIYNHLIYMANWISWFNNIFIYKTIVWFIEREHLIYIVLIWVNIWKIKSTLFQVGSHYHFIEVNPYLIFDRRKAYGMRLNIPAGTATRFEVELAAFIDIFIFLSICYYPIKYKKNFWSGLFSIHKYSAYIFDFLWPSYVRNILPSKTYLFFF